MKFQSSATLRGGGSSKFLQNVSGLLIPSGSRTRQRIRRAHHHPLRLVRLQMGQPCRDVINSRLNAGLHRLAEREYGRGLQYAPLLVMQQNVHRFFISSGGGGAESVRRTNKEASPDPETSRAASYL